VTTVVAAWADLDFHQIDSTNRDVALEIAYRRLESIGRRPTLLVHTGNGLQAWWLYQRPAAISGAWPAEQFEAINRGIAQRLGGDHVHDLARVLRVPGTVNLPDEKKRARGCVPVMARLLDGSGPSYHPFDFLPMATPQITSPGRRPRSLPVAAERGDEIIAAFSGLILGLGPHHPLTRTWEGRRHLRDATRSGFDWALAIQCSRVGVKPQLVVALLRAFGFGKGSAATDSYLDRTITRAYERERRRHAG
jgi:hypothetical protein